MNASEFQSYLKRVAVMVSNLPKDVAVLAADEFDTNFERQGFFGDGWAESKRVERYRIGERKQGSTLLQTGNLRRSIRYSVQGGTIRFSSDVPYASIHNEGGEINHPGGTAFVKKNGKAIWVSNRTAAGKNYHRTRPHKIVMPRRQFVGNHPDLEKAIAAHIEYELKNV